MVRLVLFVMFYGAVAIGFGAAVYKIASPFLTERRRKALGRKNARALLAGSSESDCFLCDGKSVVDPNKDMYFDGAGWCHRNCYEQSFSHIGHLED